MLFGTHAHYQIRNPQQQRDENPGDHAELLEQRVQLTYPCPNCGSRNEKVSSTELISIEGVFFPFPPRAWW